MLIEVNFNDKTPYFLLLMSILDRFIFNFDISGLECANDNEVQDE